MKTLFTFTLLAPILACGGQDSASGSCEGGEVSVGGICVPVCQNDSVCDMGDICIDGVCSAGIRPQLTTHSPGAGDVDVSAGTEILLTFSLEMQPASAEAALAVIGPEGAMAGQRDWNDSHTVLTFAAASPFPAGEEILVKVAETALSASGIALFVPAEFRFVVKEDPAGANDTVPPTASFSPVNIVISGPDLDALGAFEFSLTASDADTSVEFVYMQVTTASSSPDDAAWSQATLQNGTWRWTWYPLDLAAPFEGTRAVHAKAIDLGENVGTAQHAFAVDLLPPAQPTHAVSHPSTTHKFPTMPIDILSEAGSLVDVHVDDVPIAGSPFQAGDPSGAVTIPLPLAAVGDARSFLFYAIDSEGNRNSDPLRHLVTRVAYDCLLNGSAFDAYTGLVVSGPTVVDAELGHVAVSFQLDPTVGADSTILSDSPDTPDGNSTEIRVYNYTKKWRGLMRFDNGLLPACAAEVVEAKLDLTIWRSGSGTYLYTGSARAHALLQTWDESTVTWNSRGTGLADWSEAGAGGTYDSEGLGIGIADNNNRALITLTSVAQRWQAGNLDNNGVLLREISSAEVSFYALTVDYSSPSARPRLDLILREPN